MGKTWKDADHDGDLVLTESPPESPSPYHLFVVIDSGARLAITSTMRSGVTTFPLRLAHGILGVYRLTDADAAGSD